MTDAPPSDAFKNLVVFIIVLAVAVTIFTLASYFAVELPAQQTALHEPVWNHQTTMGWDGRLEYKKMMCEPNGSMILPGRMHTMMDL